MSSFRQYTFPVRTSQHGSGSQYGCEAIEPFDYFMQRVICGMAKKKDIVGYIMNLIARQDAQILSSIKTRLDSINR